MSKHTLHSAKRPLAMLMAMLMVFALVPATAFAEPEPVEGTASLITNQAEATAAKLTEADWDWENQAIAGAHWMIFDYTVGDTAITVTGFEVNDGTGDVYTSGTLALAKAAGSTGRVGIEAADLIGAAADAKLFPKGTYTITLIYTIGTETDQELTSEVLEVYPDVPITLDTVDFDDLTIWPVADWGSGLGDLLNGKANLTYEPSATEENTFVATGELGYVEWPEFNVSVQAEQSGYYAAFSIQLPDAVKDITPSASGTVLTLGTDPNEKTAGAGCFEASADSQDENKYLQIVLWRGETGSAAEFEFSIDWDGDGAAYEAVDYTIDFTAVTYAIDPPIAGTAQRITNQAEATAAKLTDDVGDWGSDWDWENQSITGAHWIIFDYTVGDNPITLTRFVVKNGTTPVYDSETINVPKAAGSHQLAGIEAADVKDNLSDTLFPNGTYTITLFYTIGEETDQELTSKAVVVSDTPVGVDTLAKLETALSDGLTNIIVSEGFSVNTTIAIPAGTKIRIEVGKTLTIIDGATLTGTGTITVSDGATLTITGGKFSGITFAPLSTGTIEISGGYFTATPAEYVKTGYVTVLSDDPDYVYMVVAKETGAPEVVAGETLPDAAEDLDADDALVDALLAALADTATPDEIIAAAAAEANRLAEDTDGYAIQYATQLDELDPTGLLPITYVVQPYLDITITGYTEGDAGEGILPGLTLDIKAMYNLIATTVDPAVMELGEDAVYLEKGQTLTVNTPVTITIPLDDELGALLEGELYIKHVKDNGDTYIYTGTVYESPDGYYLIFTSTHGFSTFTVLPGDTKYTVSFDANNGKGTTMGDVETIGDYELPANTFTRSGYSFTGWKVGNKGDLILDEATITVVSDITLYAQWKSNGGSSSSSSGGGGGGTTETIKIATTTNGTVKASSYNPSKGATVTLTVTPKDGYELDSLVITDASGKELTYTDKGNGTFTFVYDTGTVTVTAKFKAVGTSGDVTLNFTDVSASDWFYDSVKFVVGEGLFNGTSATTFSPNASMTRAMFATVLARLEGADLSGYTTSRFSDVPVGQWYTASIEWAADNGIVGGIGDGKFDPDAEITREQMAVMLYRYIQYKGYTLDQVSDPNTFADDSQISSWAKEAVDSIQQSGLITGKPNNLFDPLGTATRAEVATLFARFVEALAA